MQHLNYFTLQSISEHLNQLFSGGRIIEIFTQQKDELIVVILHKKKENYLRVSCKGDFQFIIPQDEFRRAKSNSLNLFSSLERGRIQHIGMINNERAFYIDILPNEAQIDDQESSINQMPERLIFKMFGNRSNVIHMKPDPGTMNYKVIHIFRQSLSEDLQFNFENLKENPPNTFEEFRKKLMEYDELTCSESSEEQKIIHRINSIYPIFDKYFIQKLELTANSVEIIWERIQSLIKEASKPPYYLVEDKESIAFFLFEPLILNPESTITQFSNITDALNEFIRRYFTKKHFRNEYNKVEQVLVTQLKKNKNLLQSNLKTLEKWNKQRSDEEIANIIMANLHSIPLHTEEVILYDFYNECDIKIILDKLETPQQNAVKFYQKYKDGLKKAERTITQQDILRQNIEPLTKASKSFQEVTNLKELKKFKLEFADLFADRLTAKNIKAIFKEFLWDDYRIFVGRNAKNNDELTFGYAGKHDLWLHAKDVSGSHVIVKRKGILPFPLGVIEFAAGLAAYFSGLRNNPLVTVSYTTRKYVRKHKRLPPGQVILEREDTLLIEPINPAEIP